jgi:hypothetical protein
MQRDTSAINATFARRARHRRHFRDIGDSSATCAHFRRNFPAPKRYRAPDFPLCFPMSNQVPRCVFLHLSFISTSYHVYFHLVHIFTYHFTLPGTFYHHHYQLPSPSFYYVLNNTSQALVAVSSSGHIRIAPHT